MLFRFVKYGNVFEERNGKPFGSGYTVYLQRRMTLLSLLRTLSFLLPMHSGSIRSLSCFRGAIAT